MRADRLLSILLLLQAKGQLSAHQLAEQLEVSERTIQRDMLALSAAGIPVMAERGSAGGWKLLDGYRTNLTGLNAAELQTLFVLPSEQLFSDLGLHRTAEDAMLKLLAALPSTRRQDAAFMRQRIHIDLSGWSRSKDDVSCLPLLQEAIWEDCKIQLSYRRSDGTSFERLLDPLGLVAKGSVWYLVAAEGEGDPITYRVSRIQAVKITEHASQRPAEFDLAAYWTQSTAEFFANLPRFPTLMRVSPDILPRLAYAGRFPKIEHIAPPEADGWSLARIGFDIEEEAVEFALGFGTNLEVIEPVELRQKVIDAAEQVIAFYRVRKQ